MCISLHCSQYNKKQTSYLKIMMLMVSANNMSIVPIESKLMRCSTSNNPANKPESIENNKQAYSCHWECRWRCCCCCCCFRCRSVRVEWLSVVVMVVAGVVMMVSLLRLAGTFGSSNSSRISCCKWLKPNFPNNLNVESSASVDSIVCKIRCWECNIAYRLLNERKMGAQIRFQERKRNIEKNEFEKKTRKFQLNLFLAPNPQTKRKIVPENKQIDFQ